MGTGGTAKEQSILIGNAEIRQNLFAASAAERSPISLMAFSYENDIKIAHPIETI